MSEPAPVTPPPVGQWCVATLASGTALTGRVFAVDGARMVLESWNDAADPSGKIRDVNLLNLNFVRKIDPLPDRATGAYATPLALPVDLVVKREKAAFQLCESTLADGPPGASREELEIYAILSKTFDISWRDRNMEEAKLGVLIKPPFRAKDVSGKDVRAVERVRDVLERIRTKLQEKNIAAMPVDA